MRALCICALASLIAFAAEAQRISQPVSAQASVAPRNRGANSPAPPLAKSSAETASAPRKVVVRNGGTKEPTTTITSGLSPAELQRANQQALAWLDSTDGALQGLAGRSFTPDQQETVTQIHNYMKGARTALTDGDIRRASTLALKAHWLSDDLLRQPR
jgi:hypothetical protein